MSGDTPAPSTTAPAAKTLSRFDLTSLGINAIVGSGIYLLPGNLAAELGSASILCFALCGVLSLVVALCFADLCRRFTDSGGPYVYARAAVGSHRAGPLATYLVGFSCYAAAVLSWATVALGLAEQIGALYAPLAAHKKSVACLATALLMTVNLRGIKPGAWVTDTLTIAKITPLLVLLFAAATRFRRANVPAFLPKGARPLPGAIYSAMFAYQGFEVVPVPAGQAQNPAKDGPFAAVSSVSACTLLYCALQFVGLGAAPEFSGSTLPMATLASTLFGATGTTLVSIAAAVSMLGFCAGVAMAGPHYLLPLATDGHLPRRLASRHPQHQTPTIAVATTGTLTILLIQLFPFDRLIDLAVFFVSVQYLSSSASLAVLRRRERVSTALPLVASALVLLLVALGMAHGKVSALATQASMLLAVGLGLRAIFRRQTPTTSS